MYYIIIIITLCIGGGSGCGASVVYRGPFISSVEIKKWKTDAQTVTPPSRAKYYNNIMCQTFPVTPVQPPQIAINRAIVFIARHPLYYNAVSNDPPITTYLLHCIIIITYQRPVVSRWDEHDIIIILSWSTVIYYISYSVIDIFHSSPVAKRFLPTCRETDRSKRTDVLPYFTSLSANIYCPR